MKIDNALVDKLATLAKLEFDSEEKQALIKDLNNILTLVEKLDELDTEGVEPLIYLTEEVNRLRPDEVKQEITKEEALKNAPNKDSDYIKVPKVLKKDRE